MSSSGSRSATTPATCSSRSRARRVATARSTRQRAHARSLRVMRPDRARARRLCLRLLVGLAAVAVVGAPAAAGEQSRLEVAIFPRAHARAVPQDFLGLSFEVAAVPRLTRYASTGNLEPLMRSLGRGVLRLGGVTADSRAYWAGGGRPVPDWGRVAIRPADLAGIGRLARATRWRVVLTVNLAHYDAQAAAEEVAAAKSVLGASLAGVEI